ncbi:hypothetical protein COLO4_35835 [Corchorus olitorius]|uniref:Uncharacterized protein n=1 Tax=Corchorus olitorius TaxID=93759 RepID=A0A1R3GD12_9ROSI|nr:hypothetical protein COLO4_35835 [Corchorus olitorius]
MSTATTGDRPRCIGAKKHSGRPSNFPGMLPVPSSKLGFVERSKADELYSEVPSGSYYSGMGLAILDSFHIADLSSKSMARPFCTKPKPATLAMPMVM